MKSIRIWILRIQVRFHYALARFHKGQVRATDRVICRINDRIWRTNREN
jgi:hypothetical protein